MANKTAEYIRNLGKSIGYAAVDVAKKEFAPSAVEFIETNNDLFKTIYNDIKDYKTTTVRVSDFIKKSQVYEAANTGVKAIFEDIRTGKLYNKERIDKIDAKVLGMDEESMADDFGDFGDFDAGSDDGFGDFGDLSEGDKTITDAILASSESSSAMISNVVVRSAQQVMENDRRSTGIMYTQNAKGFAMINSGMSAINENISKMMKFNLETVQTLAQNATTFFDTTTKLDQDRNKILLEIRDALITKPKEQKQSDKITFDQIVGSNGTPDLRLYAKAVKKNISGVLSSSGLGMLDAMDGNVLETFAASPLSGLMTLLVRNAIPKDTKKSMNKLDQTIQGTFGSLMAKFNTMAQNRDNQLLSTIGSIFGVKNKYNTSVDTAGYKKDKVDWDGKSRKALIEVIPTQLSQIISLLSGEPEKLYNYNTGRFVTSTSLSASYKNKTEGYAKSATSDMREEFEKFMKYMTFNSIQERDQLKKDIDKFFTTLYKEGKMYDYNRKNGRDEDPYDFNIDSKNMAIIRAMFKNSDRSKQLQLNQNILDARSRETKEIERISSEEDPIVALFNESGIGRRETATVKLDSKGRVTGSKSLIEKSNPLRLLDDKGHNIFYYLQNMYKELMYLRSNSTKMASGSNSVTSSPRIITSRDSYERTIGIDDMIIEDKSSPSIASLDRIQEERRNAAYQREKKRFEDKQKNKKIKDPIMNISETDNEKQIESFLARSRDRDRIKEALEERKEEKQGLLDRLLEAESVSGKLEEAVKTFNNISKKPAEYFTKMIDKADQRIYELIYGKEEGGNKVRGFLDAMIYEMKGTFSKFNDFLDEKVLKPLKDKLGVDYFRELPGKILEELGIKDQLTGFKDAVKEGIKNVFTGAFNTVKGAVTGVAGDIRSRFPSKIKDKFTDLDEMDDEDFEEYMSSNPVEDLSYRSRRYVDQEYYDNWNIANEENNQSSRSKVLYEKAALASMEDKYAKNKAYRNKGLEADKRRLNSMMDTYTNPARKDSNTLLKKIENLQKRIEESEKLAADERSLRSKTRADIIGQDRTENRSYFKDEYKKVLTNILGLDTNDPEVKKMLLSALSKGHGDFDTLSELTLDDLVNSAGMNNSKRQVVIDYINNVYGGKGNVTLSDVKKRNVSRVNSNTPSAKQYAEMFPNLAYESIGGYSNSGGIVNDKIQTELLNNVKDIRNMIASFVGINVSLNPDIAKHPEGSAMTKFGANIGNMVSNYMFNGNPYGKTGSIFGPVKGIPKFAEGSNGALKESTVATVGEGEIVLNKEAVKVLSKALNTNIKSVSDGKTSNSDIATNMYKSFNRLDPKDSKALDMNQIQTILNENDSYNAMAKVDKNRFLTIISKSLGAYQARTDEEIEKEKDSTMTKQIVDSGTNLIRSVSASLSGNPEKDKKAMMSALNDVVGNFTKYAPEGIGGALLGAGVSMIPGVIGGPLLGATVGAGLSIVKNSEKVQEWLFGKRDEETNERQGGVFSKKTMDKVAKYLPDMKKYGITGLIAGAMPFVPVIGPVGGLLMGSTVAYIKNNEDFRRSLFGDEKVFQGLDRHGKKLKANLGRMGFGAIAGNIVGAAVGGPFGIIGNSLIGAAAGYISTSNKVQEMILGKKDKDGVYQGGLLPKLRETIVSPTKKFMKWLGNDIKEFLKNDIMNPLKEGFAPFKQMGKNMIKSVGKFFLGKIDKFVENKFGKPLSGFAKDILGIGKKVAKAPFKLLYGGAKKVISAPFKLFGTAGNAIRKRQVNKGTATDMTASERNIFRETNGLSMDTDAALWDQQLENIDDSQLEILREGLGNIVDPRKNIIKNRNEVTKEARDAITNAGFSNTFAEFQISKFKGSGKQDFNDIKNSILNKVSLSDNDLYDFGTKYKSTLDKYEKAKLEQSLRDTLDPNKTGSLSDRKAKVMSSQMLTAIQTGDAATIAKILRKNGVKSVDIDNRVDSLLNNYSTNKSSGFSELQESMASNIYGKSMKDLTESQRNALESSISEYTRTGYFGSSFADNYKSEKLNNKRNTLDNILERTMNQRFAADEALKNTDKAKDAAYKDLLNNPLFANLIKSGAIDMNNLGDFKNIIEAEIRGRKKQEESVDANPTEDEEAKSEVDVNFNRAISILEEMNLSLRRIAFPGYEPDSKDPGYQDYLKNKKKIIDTATDKKTRNVSGATINVDTEDTEEKKAGDRLVRDMTDGEASIDGYASGSNGLIPKAKIAALGKGEVVLNSNVVQMLLTALGVKKNKNPNIDMKQMEKLGTQGDVTDLLSALGNGSQSSSGDLNNDGNILTKKQGSSEIITQLTEYGPIEYKKQRDGSLTENIADSDTKKNVEARKLAESNKNKFFSFIGKGIDGVKNTAKGAVDTAKSAGSSILSSLFGGGGIKGAASSLLSKLGGKLGITSLGKLLPIAGTALVGADIYKNGWSGSNTRSILNKGASLLGFDTTGELQYNSDGSVVTDESGNPILTNSQDALSNFGDEAKNTAFRYVATGGKMIGAKTLSNGIAKSAAKSAAKNTGLAKLGITNLTKQGANLGAKGLNKAAGATSKAYSMISKKVASKTAKSAAKSAEKTVAKKGLSSIVQYVGSKLIKLFTNGLVVNILGKETCEKMVKKAIPTLLEKVSKKAAGLAAKTIAKASAMIASGGLVTIAFAAYDFISGYRNADEILSIEEPSFGEKIIAGIIKASSNLFIITALIPENVWADLLLDTILPIFGVENTKLQQKRKKQQAKVDEYNAANGTNLTISEYKEAVSGSSKAKDDSSELAKDTGSTFSSHSYEALQKSKKSSSSKKGTGGPTGTANVLYTPNHPDFKNYVTDKKKASRLSANNNKMRLAGADAYKSLASESEYTEKDVARHDASGKDPNMINIPTLSKTGSAKAGMGGAYALTDTTMNKLGLNDDVYEKVNSEKVDKNVSTVDEQYRYHLMNLNLGNKEPKAKDMQKAIDSLNGGDMGQLQDTKKVFVDAGKKSGIDGRMLLAIAAADTNFGKSKKIKKYNNYFGWKTGTSPTAKNRKALSTAYSKSQRAAATNAVAKAIKERFVNVGQNSLYRMQWAKNGSIPYSGSPGSPSEKWLNTAEHNLQLMYDGGAKMNNARYDTEFAGEYKDPGLGNLTFGYDASNPGDKGVYESADGTVYGNTKAASDSSDDEKIDLFNFMDKLFAKLRGAVSDKLGFGDDKDSPTLANEWFKSTIGNGELPLKVTSKFNERRDLDGDGKYENHTGIDFGSSSPKTLYGQTVKSPVPGEITAIGDVKDGLGKKIVIKDDNNNYHTFGHLEGYLGQKVGDKVKIGTTIGYVGNSGNAYPQVDGKPTIEATHLHYEISNEKNERFDPNTYLATVYENKDDLLKYNDSKYLKEKKKAAAKTDEQKEVDSRTGGHVNVTKEVNDGSTKYSDYSASAGKKGGKGGLKNASHVKYASKSAYHKLSQLGVGGESYATGTMKGKATPYPIQSAKYDQYSRNNLIRKGVDRKSILGIGGPIQYADKRTKLGMGATTQYSSQASAASRFSSDGKYSTSDSNQYTAQANAASRFASQGKYNTNGTIKADTKANAIAVGKHVSELALQQVGKPYVWGANGPDSFDCSGLCQWAYINGSDVDMNKFGRTTYDFNDNIPTTITDKSKLRPGDLLLCRFDSSGQPQHVAMYAGDNRIAEARGAAYGVVERELNEFTTSHADWKGKRILTDDSQYNSANGNTSSSSDDSDQNSDLMSLFADGLKKGVNQAYGLEEGALGGQSYYAYNHKKLKKTKLGIGANSNGSQSTNKLSVPSDLAGIVGTGTLSADVEKYGSAFDKAGSMEGVDPYILRALSMQESGGDAHASGGGAYGLTQIQVADPGTMEEFAAYGRSKFGRSFTANDAFDPSYAIPFTANKLKFNLDRYGGDYMKALQAYNFGYPSLDMLVKRFGDDWRAHTGEMGNINGYGTPYGDKDYLPHVLQYYHGSYSENSASGSSSSDSGTEEEKQSFLEKFSSALNDIMKIGTGVDISGGTETTSSNQSSGGEIGGFGSLDKAINMPNISSDVAKSSRMTSMLPYLASSIKSGNISDEDKVKVTAMLGQLYQKSGTGLADQWYSKTLGAVESSPYTIGMRYLSDGTAGKHQAIDYASTKIKGKQIKSPIAGTITNIATDPNGLGNYMVVQDKNKYFHYFGHMDKLPNKSIGDSVTINETLGTVGSSGHSTGPHLHYEIRNSANEDDRPDPNTYLAQMYPNKQDLLGKLGNIKSSKTLKANSLGKGGEKNKDLFEGFDFDKELGLGKYEKLGKGAASNNTKSSSDKYLAILESIVKILITISDNSECLSKIVDILSTKLGVDTTSLKQSNPTSKKETTKKISDLLKNNMNISGNSGETAENKYILNILETLATE